MKKILLLFIISLALTSFKSSFNSEEFSIVGKWEGEDNSEIGYFIFQEEGYVMFEYQGQVLGGKDFEINGEKGSSTYIVDYSKNPLEIDLIIKKTKTEKTLKMLCIAEIINKNEIKFAIGFNENRPMEFNINNSIIFKRLK